MAEQIVILVDGDSASGKGTIAAHLAQHFNLAHLDTGLIYRAVGLLCHRAGIPETDTVNASKIAEDFCRKRDLSLFDDPVIRSVEVGFLATKYGGQNPEIRSHLFDFQKDFCRLPHPGKNGAVLDGRHLAFEIWPEADAKFYITASAEARAQRRLLQLQQLGQTADYAAVLKNITERDLRDKKMLMEKLGIDSVVAPGAIYMDTTTMTRDEVLESALKQAEQRLRAAKSA